MSRDWRSADALRDGWVLVIDDSAVAGGSDPAVPASPRTPCSERPVARARRAKAQELVEGFDAEGRVRITDPDDDEAAVAARRQLRETAWPGTSGQAHWEGSVRWAWGDLKEFCTVPLAALVVFWVSKEVGGLLGAQSGLEALAVAGLGV